MMQKTLPKNPDDLRQCIYAGQIFHVPAITETRRLVADVYAALEDNFAAPLQGVHARMSFDEMKQPLAKLRHDLEHLPRYAQAGADILSTLGLAGAAVRRDALRLRCVLNAGHQSPLADRAYAAHRDTWFGNPQSQINFWIPLHDVTPAQSFTFYPSYFNAPLKNTSGGFDYMQWMQVAGWQGAKTLQKPAEVDYPQALETPEDSHAFSFAAKAGDIIIFAASHLHQTVKNASGLTRFSLDFRAVHIADHAAGIGAPNPDNASQPDALRDYA